MSKKILPYGHQHIDEQDIKILDNYSKFAISLGIDASNAEEVVNEAFLYLKMQGSTDIDPIKQGDQFGAGFS